MASKTDICNWALFKLGEIRVSNIDTENTEPANIMAALYDLVRDSMLQMYPWNFAMKRETLAPLSAAPAWGWNYAYQLPSDCLALHSIRYDPKYVVENGAILTDEGSALYVLYIRKITNEGLFSPLFNEAFAAKLAVEACEKITQSNTKKQLLEQDLRVIIDQAYRSDAIEGLPDVLPEDDFLLARV